MYNGLGLWAPQRRWSLYVACCLTTLLLAACALPSASQRQTPTPGSIVTAAQLRQRPLHIPSLAPGSACKTTKGSQVTHQFGVALGTGPVYPVGLGTEGVLQYGSAEAFGGGDWGGEKVLWIVSPTYQGPVLVRGRQLDGVAEVRFERGTLPADALEFNTDGQDEGWRGAPTFTRVRTPGCYAYQVDGANFTEIIVFRAAYSAT